MLIRNKSTVAREIETGELVEPGATVDVPDELANGTPPKGKEGAPDYDPGTSGLLAQEDVWDVAKAPSSKADKSTSSEENG